MTDTPMSQAELHNAIVDLRAQAYAAELMIGRLFLIVAQSQQTDDPQSLVDTLRDACLADASGFLLNPPYQGEAEKDMRAKIKRRVNECFSSLIPASPPAGQR